MNERLFRFNPFQIMNWTEEQVIEQYTEHSNNLIGEDTPLAIANDIELYSDMGYLIGEMVARYSESVANDEVLLKTNIANEVYRERDQWLKEKVDKPPAIYDRMIRFFDFAATVKKKSDYTASCLLYVVGDTYYIEMERGKRTWEQNRLYFQSKFDEGSFLAYEKEGGSSGFAAESDLERLAAQHGVKVQSVQARGDKVANALVWSSLAEKGKVYLINNGAHTTDFLSESQQFPDGDHDDMIDAASGAFKVALKSTTRVKLRGSY